MEGSIQVIGAKIESQALMNISLTRDTGLALLALELLNSDQVEALATIGLEKGFDSRLLRRLAGGASPPDPDLRECFRYAVRRALRQASRLWR